MVDWNSLDQNTWKAIGSQLMAFARGVTVPIFWGLLHPEAQVCVCHNAAAFVLDCGGGPFGVTAAHVVEQYSKDRAADPKVTAQLGQHRYDLDRQLISVSAEADLATFRLGPTDVAALGVTVLQPLGSGWPPAPPATGERAFFLGFPGVERRGFDGQRLGFPTYFASALVASVGPRRIFLTLGEGETVNLMAGEPPPDDYDLGGVSGAPLISISAPNGVDTWRLVGVVVETSTSLQIVSAARVDTIHADGTLV